MSTSSTEAGTDQGSTSTGSASTDQGSGAGKGTDQGSTQTGADGYTAPDLSSVTDEALRASLLKRDREAWDHQREAARYRTERNAARTEAQKARQAGETAEQKAQREAAEREERTTRLATENRDLKVGNALRDAAKDAHNVGTVAAMLAPQVELDDDGRPTNVDTLLKALRKSDPYLFKPASNDAGEGNDGSGAPSGDMNDTIRGLLGARRGRGRSTT